MWMMVPLTLQYSLFDTKVHPVHKADAETSEVRKVFQGYLPKHKNSEHGTLNIREQGNMRP